MALVRFNATVQDLLGNVQANADIEVLDQNGLLATIYSDRSGTTITQPGFQADAEGFFFFYAEQGRYTVNATAGAFSISWEDNELASSIGGRTLDITQTGTLIPGTVWGVDATAPRSRALPLSPDDGEEVTIYIRTAGSDVRNNNVSITVVAPDSIAGDPAGQTYVIDNNVKITLKYNKSDQNWELINDSLATFAGNIRTMPFEVRVLDDTVSTEVNAGFAVWQQVTMTANRDFTFDLKAGEFVVLDVIPGAFTLSYSNVTAWVGGSAPVAIGALTRFIFTSRDGGEVVGQHIGDIS